MTSFYRNSLVLAVLATLCSTSLAGAVPNPNGIDWTGSPPAFVASLYRSVLGRAPENGPGPAAWVAKVGSNPGTRRDIFMAFVGTQEYRSRFGDTSGKFSVYYKDIGTHRRNYTVAKSIPKNYSGWMIGPYSFGVSQALMGYYRAYASRP